MQHLPLDVIKLKRLDDDIITAELMTIPDELEAFYQEIECSTIDIIQRKIGGVMFDLIVDDEALINGTIERLKWPTLYWQDEEGHQEAIYGTILLCHGDRDTGELLSVDPMELLNVQSAFREVMAKDQNAKNSSKIVLLFHEIF